MKRILALGSIVLVTAFIKLSASAEEIPEEALCAPAEEQNIDETVLQTEVENRVADGFVIQDGITYYYQNGTSVKDKEIFSDNKWYYFDKNGQMVTGWVQHHGNQYYYDENGVMAHGIYYVGNIAYGFNEWTGVLLSGEHYFTDGSSDQWYYFSEASNTKGQMAIGWTKHHGNQYYYNEKGQMIHGIYQPKEESYVYMFDEWTGVKKTGWVPYQNEWYYMDSEGHMYFDEHYMEGHWYYFDETTGITANKGFTKHHDHWYYYNDYGYMQYGEKYIGKGWYYFNEYTGVMATGWTTHHGNQYYYDENGMMVHGEKTIDGKKYIFDEVTGVLVSQSRAYQNPPQYYQIKDSILLSGGGYNLDIGYEGLKVAWVKKALGMGDSVGLYGALYTNTVASRVKTFQRQAGLPQTGVVDIFTWKAMGYSEEDWFNLGAYVSPVRVNSKSTRSDHIEAMIARAYDYLGTSYIIGASGAPGTGVDCSGLAMQALYAAGIDMSPINPVRHSRPGYEYESANMWASPKFKHVSLAERQRGDLIFYQNSRGTVIHVAIYLGNDQVIESTCAPFNKVVVQPLKNAYRANIKGVARPFV